MKSKKGFTLVELIIVIAIVAILAAVAFVAVDPARRLHESRNAARWTNVTSISDTLNTYYTDNDGKFPDDALNPIADQTVDEYYMIGTCTTEAILTDCPVLVGKSLKPNCAELDLLVTENYLNKIPVEDIAGPNGAYTALKTGYFIKKPASGPLGVGACYTEGEDAGGGGTGPVIFK